MSWGFLERIGIIIFYEEVICYRLHAGNNCMSDWRLFSYSSQQLWEKLPERAKVSLFTFGGDATFT
jgi:hypothetical protein